MKLAARSTLVVLLAACGDEGATGDPTMIAVGPCEGTLSSVPGEAGVHMPAGSTIEWSSNPPATGAHYPSWAGWDRAYATLDRGYWLHNAEHGGVVLLYSCPGGPCPEVVDGLLQYARDAAPDDTCAAPITKRVIVAGDPLLPEGVQVAAVGWNTYYTASCVDDYLTTFLRTHYRHGVEDTCADGNPIGGARIMPNP